MYPSMCFKGKLIVDKLVKNRHSVIHKTFYSLKRNRSIVFFSGGVDANFTLLSKLDEKPMLLTLWGSDLFFNNEDEWKIVSNQNENGARKLGLPYTSIKSSFRFFINYSVLNAKIKDSGATSYWHGFQHGIGLIAHAAPLAWLYRIKRVYISSSYSYKDEDVKCASYPSIDEKLRFCGCDVIHYDINVTRQQKVESIVKLAYEKKIDISLRVCWKHAKGTNCSRCEKCVRTFFAVLSEGGDPGMFGFKNDEKTCAEIERLLLEREIVTTPFYGELVENFLKDKEKWSDAPHVQALLKVYQPI